MTISRTSWRKPLRLEKGDVVCARLILLATIGAVINHGFQRGSERTICPSKWPNRTAGGGHNLSYLQFLCTLLPGSQTIPACLSNSMVGAVPICAPAVIEAVITVSTKRGCSPLRRHPLINYLDLYLSSSNRILNSCSCSSSVFAERNS